MNIAVAIPTYNRDHLLPKLLQSLALQINIESLKWEIIIVDNKSNDKTQIVEQSIPLYSHSDS